MKRHREDRDFNSPQEILVRATFLLCLVSFAAGVLVAVAGAVARDVRGVLGGFALLAISWGARTWLKRRRAFESASAAWQDLAQEDPRPDETHVAELVRLLGQWDALESRRGSPGFDPWALQAVRHDIRAMVEEDPALAALFHDRRRAA